MCPVWERQQIWYSTNSRNKSTNSIDIETSAERFIFARSNYSVSVHNELLENVSDSRETRAFIWICTSLMATLPIHPISVPYCSHCRLASFANFNGSMTLAALIMIFVREPMFKLLLGCRSSWSVVRQNGENFPFLPGPPLELADRNCIKLNGICFCPLEFLKKKTVPKQQHNY